MCKQAVSPEPEPAAASDSATASKPADAAEQGQTEVSPQVSIAAVPANVVDHN
jgi:hypothetical protein